mmetsp:Transcript_21446/g.33676  ORF Transcript_21446/g.33676 Transcript_21446/m.33676 type:complete len:250 (-) Transcript_21446:2077-2826(-)
MGYIIPCRGKRRRIVCSDEDAKKEDGNTTHQTNTDEQRNRAESVASTAATNPESDTDEDEDPLAEEATQLQNEIVLKKLQRVNGEGDEVQLLHTSSRAKLFEYVKGGEDNDEGTWAYRGEGQVKFIRCLEEGYNRGMIRMELTKNCTLEILMCHEVTHEDAMSMNSNRGKAYTWICKDWAYDATKKTFAIRFDDSMQALEWKQMFEQSKINNCNVRRGVGIPNAAAVDDVTSTFKSLSTATASTASPSK